MAPVNGKFRVDLKMVGQRAAQTGADVYVWIGTDGKSPKPKWMYSTQDGDLVYRHVVAPALPGDDIADGVDHVESELGITLLDVKSRSETCVVGTASRLT